MTEGGRQVETPGRCIGQIGEEVGAGGIRGVEKFKIV